MGINERYRTKRGVLLSDGEHICRRSLVRQTNPARFSPHCEQTSIISGVVSYFFSLRFTILVNSHAVLKAEGFFYSSGARWLEFSH